MNTQHVINMYTASLTKLKVPELKALLKSKGLKISGRKTDLIARLTIAHKEETGQPDIEFDSAEDIPTSDSASDDNRQIIPFFGQKGTFAPFSNWYYAPFIVDDIQFYATEQYMMYRKALLFDDNDIAEQILSTIPDKYINIDNYDASKISTYKEWRAATGRIKKLGRQVSNFNEDEWVNNREDIMLDGLRGKFEQNEDYKNLLIDTDDAILVEAAPRDRIWGVGVDAEKAKDRNNWKGLNLLGKLLMTVRSEFA